MEDPQTRLNRYLADRAEELDLTLVEVAQRSGIGRSTLDKVRHNVSHTERRTRRRLSEGLGWTPGSVDAIIAGSEPTLADTPQIPAPQTYTPPVEKVGVSADALTAAVERLQHAEGALVRAQTEVTSAQAALRAMVEQDLSDPPDEAYWSPNGHLSPAI